MRGDKQKHVAISHLPDTFMVRRSWHRLNGCRSVTGSVPQLLWMSTEIINCCESLSQAGGHVNFARDVEVAAVGVGTMN